MISDPPSVESLPLIRPHTPISMRQPEPLVTPTGRHRNAKEISLQNRDGGPRERKHRDRQIRRGEAWPLWDSVWNPTFPAHAATTCADMKAYRTEIPDRFVYILAAMFIEASSWKSSLAA